MWSPLGVACSAYIVPSTLHQAAGRYTIRQRKVKYVPTQRNTQLVIELSPEEFSKLQTAVMSSEPELLQGVAKQLVVHAGTALMPTVLVPETTHNKVQMVQELRVYGLRGDLPPLPEWASSLGFTVEELGSQPVKNAIGSWAGLYSGAIGNLAASMLTTSYTDQRSWLILAATCTTLVEFLCDDIRAAL